MKLHTDVKFRRKCLSGAALGAALLLAAACTDAGTASDPDATPNEAGAPELQEMIYVTPSGMLVGYADVFVAQSLGYFEDEGLDVQIEPGQGSAQSIQQVVGGQSLVSRTGGIDLIQAIAGESVPIKSIGTIQHGNPFNVISHESDPLDSPEEFEGRTIGVVSVGGGTETILDLMLEQHQIDPNTVTRESVGNAPSVFSLVEEDRLDAFIASIDTVKTLEEQGLPISTFRAEEYAPIPGQAYIASEESIDSSDERLTRFMRAVQRSVEFILDDASNDYNEVLPLLEEYDIPGIEDRDASRLGLEAQVELWLTAGEDNIIRNVPEAWEEAQQIMLDGGLIDEKVSNDRLFTNEFLNN